MNLREIKKYVKEIKTEFKPFHPTDNDDVLVYARLEESVIDHTGNYEQDPQSKKVVENRYLYVELFTPEMLDYNFKHFVNDEIDEYRHISYTFSATVPVGSLGSEMFSVLRNEQDKNGYVPCKLKNMNSLFPRNSIHIVGDLILGCGIPALPQLESIQPILTSAVLCWERDSISTDDSIKEKLEILGKTLDEIINNPDKYNNFMDEKPEPDLLGTPDKSTVVKVFNVGDGNTVWIEQDKKSILFDCGYKYDSYHQNNFAHTINYASKKIHPNTIAISHWHADHFLLLRLFHDDQLEHFIVPDLINLTTYVKTFIASHTELVIDMSKENDPENIFSSIGYSGITYYKGTAVPMTPPIQPPATQGTIAYDNTINDASYIMCLHGKKHSMILPSDASYYYWPYHMSPSLDDVDYLLLPHHGGCIYTSATVTNTSKNKKVIVSGTFNPINDIKLYGSNTKNATFPSQAMNMPVTSFVYTNTTPTQSPYVRNQL